MKLFRMKATSELQTLVNIFNENKYEIRLAGGAVRDLLLGKQPNDLDFATTAKPEQMKDMFSSVSNVQLINLTSGEKHGTITARINDKENFEITTLRIDVDTDGRHAEVEFTTDWKQDAERRDLTINSMFIGSDGTLYDYCGGWEDLTNGRVNFVGDARTRMKEDYLRILRYFRFCARFSEDPRRHTQDTEEAIRENVAGLAGVSGERIWSELTKILKSRHAGSLLDMMIRLGMGPHIGLPDELNLEEFVTVWERTNSNEIRLQPVSILTSLLKLEKDEKALCERLKYSNKEKELSSFLMKNRNRSCAPDPSKPLTRPLRPYQMMVIDLSNDKMNDGISCAAELIRYEGKRELADEFEKWIPPKFLVRGDDLKVAGVLPGEPMGLVIKELRDIWKESDFEETKESLMERIPAIHEIVLQLLEENKSKALKPFK